MTALMRIDKEMKSLTENPNVDMAVETDGQYLSSGINFASPKHIKGPVGIQADSKLQRRIDIRLAEPPWESFL